MFWCRNLADCIKVAYLPAMCQVSDKIKFCTCDPDHIDFEGNHWIFKTSREYDFGMTVIGTYMLPAIGDYMMTQHNKAAVSSRVNDPDAFDVDLHPQEGDRLLVVVVCHEHFDGAQHLEFEYENGRWESCVYYPFGWSHIHPTTRQGTLK